MTRLFVAAWPPPEAAATLAALTDAHEPGVRPVPIENLHITLRFIGDADADEVIGRLVRTELTGTAAQLGPTVVRLGDRQLMAPGAGADGLAQQVRAATAGLGVPDRWRFFGHLTLARTRPDANSAIEGAPVDLAFPLVDVRLVASRTGPTGAVYTTIATVPVR